jgi:hypothetical protein
MSYESEYEHHTFYCKPTISKSPFLHWKSLDANKCLTLYVNSQKEVKSIKLSSFEKFNRIKAKLICNSIIANPYLQILTLCLSCSSKAAILLDSVVMLLLLLLFSNNFLPNSFLIRFEFSSFSSLECALNAPWPILSGLLS